MCCSDIQACPAKGTLSFKTLGYKSQRWTMRALGITIVLSFVLSVSAARITGHWQSRVDGREYRHLLQQIDMPPMPHPGVGHK